MNGTAGRGRVGARGAAPAVSALKPAARRAAHGTAHVQVWSAHYNDPGTDDASCLVAAKQLLAPSDEPALAGDENKKARKKRRKKAAAARQELLREAYVMAQFVKADYLSALIGVLTCDEPVTIVLVHCANGSLDVLLNKRRAAGRQHNLSLAQKSGLMVGWPVRGCAAVRRHCVCHNCLCGCTFTCLRHPGTGARCLRVPTPTTPGPPLTALVSSAPLALHPAWHATTSSTRLRTAWSTWSRAGTSTATWRAGTC